MKWYRFLKSRGSRQKRPPVKKYVLVKLERREHNLPHPIALGYMKNAAGDKQSPYFVVPGLGGEVIAWCDCLPDELDNPWTSLTYGGVAEQNR